MKRKETASDGGGEEQDGRASKKNEDQDKSTNPVPKDEDESGRDMNNENGGVVVQAYFKEGGAETGKERMGIPVRNDGDGIKFRHMDPAQGRR